MSQGDPVRGSGVMRQGVGKGRIQRHLVLVLACFIFRIAARSWGGPSSCDRSFANEANTNISVLLNSLKSWVTESQMGTKVHSRGKEAAVSIQGAFDDYNLNLLLTSSTGRGSVHVTSTLRPRAMDRSIFQ